MKRILICFAALLTFAACTIDNVEPYKVEDSAILFKDGSIRFSLRNYKEADPVLAVPVNLVGPATDYERKIYYEIVDSTANTAFEGKDFQIDSAMIRAGELKGFIYLKVAPLMGDNVMTTTIRLLPSDDFHYEFKKNSLATISWSNGYTRPESYVWRSWFLLFSPYYSTAYHKIVCDCLGDEVDQYTHFGGGRNEGYTLKAITWWYAANRALRDYVEKYDAEHPGEPMMHSDDVLFFTGQYVSVADGIKPETVPTIIETLLEF